MSGSPTAPAAIARPCRDERDLWRIRSLLVETHPLVQPGWNWDIRRWDGWLFHREAPGTDAELAALVGLWETPDDRLVGAVHPEASSEAWIELHPDWRHLEPAMLDWAEERLSIAATAGPRTLALFVGDDDATRHRLLASRGYRIEETGGWRRLLRFERSVPAAGDLPDTYRLGRTRPGDDDCAHMAVLLNAAFGRSSGSRSRRWVGRTHARFPHV